VKALIVGGGGREHAIAWKLKKDQPDLDLIAAPGNPGIAALARCVAVGTSEIDLLVSLAQDESVDLTIVGPEAPLAAGLADRLRDRGLAVFGPTQAAARIETSKSFAKELMLRSHVPTAVARTFADVAPAKRAAREFGAPVVIKATGLAAGKGVVVAQSIDEADKAIDAMLLRGSMGDAGREILVEEFMQGEELSMFALTDGAHVLPMLPAQDHKRLLDHDSGPNTGGMGAYAPLSLASELIVEEVVGRILLPTLEALALSGHPFQGLLYAGLMLTPTGPRVVEFNCRFGDPETQAILPLLEGDLLTPMLEIARQGSLAGVAPFEWRMSHAVTTVVAAAGYPEAPRTGDSIQLPPDRTDVLVFHAGTRLDADGVLRSSGGRVASVTGVGESLATASTLSVAGARQVRFAGAQFRSDIGWRDLARHAGTS
jgi:phosphoribosylamine---glycine ligase